MITPETISRINATFKNTQILKNTIDGCVRMNEFMSKLMSSQFQDGREQTAETSLNVVETYKSTQSLKTTIDQLMNMNRCMSEVLTANFSDLKQLGPWERRQ